jgi:hypothetical protein
MAVLATERRKEDGGGPPEYTWYGRVLDRLMYDRGIRNPTQMFRRIKALGGYPRRLKTAATVANILKGVQNAPFEFHQYATVVLDQAKPLTEEEREQLEEAFTWGQKHPAELGYGRENLERAYGFVEEMRREHESSDEEEGGE